jgi:hypothetical protein
MKYTLEAASERLYSPWLATPARPAAPLPLVAVAGEALPGGDEHQPPARPVDEAPHRPGLREPRPVKPFRSPARYGESVMECTGVHKNVSTAHG